jgi:hypothetical protein
MGNGGTFRGRKQSLGSNLLGEVSVGYMYRSYVYRAPLIHPATVKLVRSVELLCIFFLVIIY